MALAQAEGVISDDRINCRWTLNLVLAVLAG
jgi:hypothetical protein